MHDAHRAKLESLGLTTGEAQIYLALLRSGGTLGASALSTATGLPRTGVYPLLNSLAKRGIVEAEAGYGSRFTAMRPTQALPALIARESEEQRAKLLERERLASELVEQLEALAEPVESGGEAEIIQVLRDPRVVRERFERLQLEAQGQIDVFVKEPYFANPENPTQDEALRRGVRMRGLYERAVMSGPLIEPYMASWISKGEEARIYNGILPHKLAIFDKRAVLMHLAMAGEKMTTLFVRHSELAISLVMLFDALWERSEPFTTTHADNSSRLKHSRSETKAEISDQRNKEP